MTTETMPRHSGRRDRRAPVRRALSDGAKALELTRNFNAARTLRHLADGLVDLQHRLASSLQDMGLEGVPAHRPEEPRPPSAPVAAAVAPAAGPPRPRRRRRRPRRPAPAAPAPAREPTQPPPNPPAARRPQPPAEPTVAAAAAANSPASPVPPLVDLMTGEGPFVPADPEQTWEELMAEVDNM